ncbi:hypothetical protein IE81DRAFT_16985 [Ceraceosorus guamensis]|uniref:Uncharacterized protein n=1 Tax=Ceraceosorus guamensis TaxID=1522189 RepID=A0A316VQI6_9BASI|nr:hypothetical protein IE81DRAFT_16985 [Ceraceosorus guamensis]PWN39590.1 hypothetical protein IE81DRAFT_16985 [Ceraceosorus guamensis]
MLTRLGAPSKASSEPPEVERRNVTISWTLRRLTSPSWPHMRLAGVCILLEKTRALASSQLHATHGPPLGVSLILPDYLLGRAICTRSGGATSHAMPSLSRSTSSSCDRDPMASFHISAHGSPLGSQRWVRVKARASGPENTLAPGSFPFAHSLAFLGLIVR